MTTINHNRLTERAQGRKEAEALIALCAETSLTLTHHEALAAFWDSLREFVQQSDPTPKPADPAAMTDAEVREFRSRLMTFGKVTTYLTHNFLEKTCRLVFGS